ncbi:hypothetical protein DOJK_00651 [Patescibacteria group bacterium]|nr:hypothetical protein DOJK_00651 [Patescibacteria group bacterium]
MNNQIIIQDLIKTLLNHIPRYAEEEGDFYSVSHLDLINALCVENNISEEVAINTLELLEVLLNSLSVLNRDYLDKGEWCFVSFPAQLMALSVLTAMADNESRFFDTIFWNTHSISDAKKEQQRTVLNYVENQRMAYSENAQPIRFIYVAWAIIKLDNQILFHQREDVKKRHDKKSGDYGLIGGRLNQNDIVGFDIKEKLQNLQSNDVNVNKAALTETLKRELFEEVGLEFETHYNFKLWRGLKPYRKVDGAAPNHGLTEYHFNVFFVDLTLSGYLFLQQQIKENQKLVWFFIDEMIKGETIDGKLAFINALFDDYDNKEILKADLLALPSSFISPYCFDKRDKYAVTLLLNTEKPLLAGISGKEKTIDCVLNKRQQQLLLGLAAHNRIFEFSSLVEDVILHPQGWLEIQQLELQSELIELAELFKQTPFVIENIKDQFFRLSIHPSILYFDEKLFSYCVKKTDLETVATKIPISINRATIFTAFGEIASKSEEFLITLKLADGLHKLNERNYATDNDDAQKIEERYRKTLPKEERFLALGLKALVRESSGMIKFCACYQLLNE